MSKASGLVLILAGLGVAAYAMPSGTQAPAPSRQSEAVTQAPPAAKISVAAVAEPSRREERADRPLNVGKLPPRPEVPIVAPKPEPAVKPAPIRSADPPPAFTQPPAVITLAQRPKEPAAVAPPAAAHQPSKAAAVPGDRVSLARELQRELKRVGCYEGEINGAWTPSSRKAMKAFTDRVNASLPVEAPDYILLSLVQGHRDAACGKPCPAGQTLADGRCLPQAIVAHGAKKAAPPVQVARAPERSTTTGAWSTTATAVAQPLPSAPPAEGRMALAGPKHEAAEAEARDKTASIAPGPTHRAPRFERRYPRPPMGLYDRRPPPPRYVMRTPARDPGWMMRAVFRPRDGY
jgi:hypothetical protein